MLYMCTVGNTPHSLSLPSLIIRHPFMRKNPPSFPNRKQNYLQISQFNFKVPNTHTIQHVHTTPTPTADSLLECCILLKSKKGLSPPHGTDIWAKYLGLFFRYPVGKTLSGRQKVACSVPQGGRGPRSSQGEQEGRGGHGGTCLQVEFSKASLISSSLELALLLLPVSGGS